MAVKSELALELNNLFMMWLIQLLKAEILMSGQELRCSLLPWGRYKHFQQSELTGIDMRTTEESLCQSFMELHMRAAQFPSIIPCTHMCAGWRIIYKLPRFKSRYCSDEDTDASCFEMQEDTHHRSTSWCSIFQSKKKVSTRGLNACSAIVGRWTKEISCILLIGSCM